MMINEHLIDMAKRGAETPAIKKAGQNLKRLFPAYLLCFLPFLLFGTRNDIRLILWKVAVVGCGLLIFHFTRKSMFPYIDLNRSLTRLTSLPSKADDGASLLACGMAVIAEAVVLAALAFAIIIAMAEGL